MLVPVGGAWGATKSRVSISGPRKVQRGGQVKLHFTGYAGSGVSRLRIWLDDRSCATTARAEAERKGLRHKSFPVTGQFRDLLTVERSSSGTHVVCAYLLDESTGATAARDSLRYLTR